MWFNLSRVNVSINFLSISCSVHDALYLPPIDSQSLRTALKCVKIDADADTIFKDHKILQPSQLIEKMLEWIVRQQPHFTTRTETTKRNKEKENITQASPSQKKLSD